MQLTLFNLKVISLYLFKGSRKLDDLENKSFENRQRHLFDIEGLRKKEMEYRRHSCLNSPEVKEERERLKRTEEMLKEKIRDLELLR